MVREEVRGAKTGEVIVTGFVLLDSWRAYGSGGRVEWPGERLGRRVRGKDWTWLSLRSRGDKHLYNTNCLPSITQF